MTEWDAAEKGPKVDLTGKLAEAISKRGMKVIATFHHARKSLFRFTILLERWHVETSSVR